MSYQPIQTVLGEKKRHLKTTLLSHNFLKFQGNCYVSIKTLKKIQRQGKLSEALLNWKVTGREELKLIRDERGESSAEAFPDPTAKINHIE